MIEYQKKRVETEEFALDFMIHIPASVSFVPLTILLLATFFVGALAGAWLF